MTWKYLSITVCLLMLPMKRISAASKALHSFAAIHSFIFFIFYFSYQLTFSLSFVQLLHHSFTTRKHKMQFITVLSIFFAAASASPLSFNISDYGLGPDLEDYEQELPAIFNLTDYQFGPADLQDVYEEELGGIFKRDDIFNRLQQAAGNNKLASGKSYYFLACQKFLEESETGTLEPGALWVRDQTRWDQSPHGCGHVALVMGTVNKKGSCIKCNQDKTFDGARYLDAVLYPNWKHQNKELRLSDRLV